MITLAKQKHSDEIQLYKLFKEAFDGEATVYNSIYYYDADDSSTKREVDMLVIYNNLIIVLGLNGQSGCNNKHANRSLRHNFKQMIGFINSIYKNGGVFYTTGSKDSKQRLRGVAHIFMISVVCNSCKSLTENECEASSFSTTYTMTKDDMPYLYPITFTYSSLAYIIKACCDHNLGVESFINYLFDLSISKRYTL